MRAKVILVARLSEAKTSKTGKEYVPFVAVPIKKGKPHLLPNATAYYLRYSENGKRKVEPVGANLEAAFSAFLNRDLNHARLRQGLLPIHGPAGLVADFKE